MKYLVAAVLFVAGALLPASAQRGGGGGAHGGFSGHSSGGFSGQPVVSHSAPAPRAGGARDSAVRPSAPRNFAMQRSPYSGSSNPGLRSPNNPPRRPPYRGRNHGSQVFSNPYAYGYPYYPYLPLLSDYDDGFWDNGDNSAQPAAGDNSGYGQYPEDGSGGQPPVAYPYSYPSQPYPQAPPTVYAPPADQPHPANSPQSEEEAVTLVFKDGRAPEQIHNYVLTRNILYIQDHGIRSIPIDQLDLAATEKVNQEAGVVFELPKLPN